MKRSNHKGKIIIPSDASPWPHEKNVARILAKAGHHVEFIPETTVKTPDIYLERTIYEIKSPTSGKVDAIERNLTRALEKCPNVIFDSSRMSVRDDQIKKELIKRRREGKGLKRLLFITKRGEIVDIEKLI